MIWETLKEFPFPLISKYARKGRLFLLPLTQFAFQTKNRTSKMVFVILCIVTLQRNPGFSH
ncbi:hypothetical protein DLM76_21285 [Leptospira yasudae]|nr:hypothetical protein DLM76_21285 [Leptospira yasudae]